MKKNILLSLILVCAVACVGKVDLPTFLQQKLKPCEGDIVEVWSTRRPRYSNPQSQYDGDVKVRAVIRFNYGKWTLDYDNSYNKTLIKLKGKEEDERTVDGDQSLYWFGCRGREEWNREHNAHYKWHDIVKIGTEFENSELLEG